MIRIRTIIGLPSLQYHLDNDLTLHENVYRYSSESFIQLFAEARDAWRDGLIELNEEDIQLIESTDIGKYGMYEGEKVPLDLPMLYEEDKLSKIKQELEALRPGISWIDDIFTSSYDGSLRVELDYTLYPNEIKQLAQIATKYGMELKYMTGKNASLVKGKVNENIDEAEYRGKDVPLNKPKRGGSKKFYVYTKNKKGNVVKVSFGGTTGLNVKIDEPGARASFAARHKCAQKKDKTKPGYWACNIGRYWKSLGGKRNFSGYW